MWVDDVRCGPGMLVTSTGTYCEATFANGAIAVSFSCVNPSRVFHALLVTKISQFLILLLIILVL